MRSTRPPPSISQRSADDPLGRRRLLAGGAAALALGACARSAGVKDAALPETGAPRERVVEVEGVAINSVRLGDGPPVVLIHGATGNLNDWTFAPAQVFARRHTVIAFDRPGHGRSGLPARGGDSLVVQARLMRGALAQMGIDRAILVGHSYGGSVALAWALDAPTSVTGLLLLAAPAEVWAGGLGLATDLLANPLSGPLLAHALPALVSEGLAEAAADRVFKPQTAPPGYVAHLDLDLVLQPAALRINARQLEALKPQVAALVPHYPGLAIPVEIVHGTADTTVPLEVHSEPLARAIPGARLTRLEGIGHMPHQVALPAVEAALARLAARI